MCIRDREQGVRPGDRVVAYLPNIPEAMVAFLATVSIGGVWSICAPDMGSNAVLDRFRQIAPTVLIGCDAVMHGGRQQDRLAVVAQLRAALPTVRHLLMLDHGGTLARAGAGLAHTAFADAITRDDAATRAFFEGWTPPIDGAEPAIVEPDLAVDEILGAVNLAQAVMDLYYERTGPVVVRENGPVRELQKLDEVK